MKQAATLATLVLAGCATANEYSGPDGSRYFHIECPGAAVPMSMCFDKARESCPGGYQLVNVDRHTSGYIVSQAGATPLVQKSITVRCNTPGTSRITKFD